MRGIKLGDEMIKTAKSLGIAAGEMAGFQHVASLAGVSSEQLAGAVVRLGKTVGDAKKGLSTAQRAFADLGLTWRELEQLPLSEQMLVVGDRLRNVTNHTDKLRIASDLFGRGAGARMLEVFAQGSEAIRAQLEEAKKLGTYLDSTQSRVVEEAADAQDRLKTAFSGLAIQLGATFGPAIEAVAGFLTNLTAKVTALIPHLARMAEKFLGIERAVTDLGDVDLELRLREERKRVVELGEAIDESRRKIERYQQAARTTTEELREQETLNRLIEQRAEAINSVKEAVGELNRRQAEADTPALLPSDEDIEVGAEGAADPKAGAFSTVKFLQDESRARFEELQQRMKSETQLENERFAAELVLLESQHALKTTTEQERYALAEQLRQEHEDNLTRIAKTAATEREQFEAMKVREKAAHVLGTLANMTAGVAQHNKTLFRINKLAAIGNAVMNTAQGVTKALSAYPPPLSFAMAAAQAAAGAAQISAIRSTTFEGGGAGTTPSAAGSAPTVNGQPTGAAAASPSQRLVVEGIDSDALFTGSAVRNLAQRLLDFQRDGGVVVLQQS
jgi:hypothetical protein